MGVCVCVVGVSHIVTVCEKIKRFSNDAESFHLHPFPLALAPQGEEKSFRELIMEAHFLHVNDSNCSLSLSHTHVAIVTYPEMGNSDLS